jgi:WD40 repeat protein
VVWQPFSAVAATASGDKTVSMWDTRTGLCVQTFYGHGNAVNDVAFSMRGDALASCDADGVVRVWDVRMVAERGVATLARGQPVHALAWDRSGAVLAAGCEDGTVRVLDTSAAAPGSGVVAAPGAAPLALKVAASLRGHTDAVQALAFDPTSSYLASAGNDATVRAWSDGGTMPDLRAAATAAAAAAGGGGGAGYDGGGAGGGSAGASPRDA